MDVGAHDRADGGCLAEVKAVEFEAEVRQVKSMADGTYNIILNVPEYCLPQVKVIMGWLLAEVRIVMERGLDGK